MPFKEIFFYLLFSMMMQNLIRAVVVGSLLLVNVSSTVPVSAMSIIALEDSAQYFGGSFPANTVYTPGEVVSGLQITMQNTGTTTWRASEQNIYLYPTPFNNPNVYVWNGGGIVGRSITTDVAPGQTYTFDLSGNLGLVAPQTSGTYQLQWKMYRVSNNGQDRFSFGNVAPSTPLVWTVAASTVPEYDAKHVGGSFPVKTVFAPGERVDIKLVMRNVGVESWKNCFQNLYTIIPSFGQANQGVLDGGAVACGQSYAQSGSEYVFYVALFMPQQPGEYSYQWQMASRDPGQSGIQAQPFGASTTPFVVTVAAPSVNNPPVIKGITAPSVLRVNERGEWIVSAYDPEGKPLSYYVTWGDDPVGQKPTTVSALRQGQSQDATFTHYYTTPGVYEPRFTVIDSADQKTDISATVTVKPVEQATGSIKIAVVDKDFARRIRCIKFPCAELKTAKVVVYEHDSVNDTLGEFVGSSDTNDGLARFYYLLPRKYIAYADAPGYVGAKEFFQIAGNDGQYLTIALLKLNQREPEPTLPPEFVEAFEPVLPNGSLIQLVRTKGVYYIENGQKRPIRSRSVFDARGFDLADVIIVDKTDFDRYPTGNELGAAPTTTTQGTALVDGSLVKALNDKAVYRIENGKRRPFFSGSVFEAKGYYWSDIIVVSPETFNAYPLGDTISYGHLGDGFLIKSPRSSAVYWTESGQKRHIANERVFASHAFRWQDIHVVSDEEITTYPVGPDMSQ